MTRSIAFRAHPEGVLRALDADGDAFWLDGGVGGVGGVSVVGSGIRIPAHLSAVADALRPNGGSTCLGVVGWFGSSFGRSTLEDGVAQVDGSDSGLLRVDRLIEVDEVAGTLTFVAAATSWNAALGRWMHETLARLGTSQGIEIGSAPPIDEGEATRDPHRSDARLGVTWRHSGQAFARVVREAQRLIAAGEAYQLCATTRASIRDPIDVLATYLRLRRTNPAPHSALLRVGDTALLCSSPERFLRVTTDGRVTTRPIKGTRPRGADVLGDLEQAHLLANDPKERAENVMIVDLMRNDLGRVCEVGSVEVERLWEVESFEHVHQLVSTVSGRLDVGLTAVDALSACFPAGSMTGAPKRSAVRLLSELEGAPRGPYAGVFGWLGADGSADLAVTIRTLVVERGSAWVGVGAGITADSRPEAEVAEVRLKAQALLDAVVFAPARIDLA